ncbi:MAG: 4-hydroxythreonine-4-phosphate dehydrogenase PdxA [Albidovulum sp.]|nr:4-hydroxythreonine-4-phosphate dehydrogenase PdxA [Albidovulum sp.]MDE0531268.1 4-hydroxythreonine-4-phosphate dehydrogenase PdxA [Albidovulum sp.]
MNLPVAIACGDPAGIGPEIISKAWQRLRGTIPFFVLFDPRYTKLFGNEAAVRVIKAPEDAPEAMNHGIPVIGNNFAVEPRVGKADASNAASIIRSIEKATCYAMKGRAAAVCTGPVSKFLLRSGANFDFGGQTEFLAAICGSRSVVMMLDSPSVRVVPTTRHCSISEVPCVLNQELIYSTITVTHEALRIDFGIPSPRIAVAALNPHAGERGVLGKEEETIILPTVKRLREQGLAISGPLSADSMFHEQARLHYDAAICMYHDQALIPIKALDFYRGVNVTLGLPIVRTSPDHGTAFDLAGQGSANAESMTRAIELAARLSRTRRSAGQ